MKYRIILSFLLLVLLSCGGVKKITQTKTELYFGLSNNEGPISDSTWLDFKKNHIDNILNAYTLIDANGYWTSNEGVTINEASKILVYIHKKSEVENKKIDSIINLYKRIYNQESVLKIEQKVKVKF